jgi:hypothetical protein
MTLKGVGVRMPLHVEEALPPSAAFAAKARRPKVREFEVRPPVALVAFPAEPRDERPAELPS